MQTAYELISLTASIAALILAIVAIFLSITFYRMSSAASRVTTEAARGIGASVERLEKLFDKLYSGTFSIMKDTVTDMRKHIWKAPSVDSSVEQLDEKIKERISSEVEEIAQKQKGTELKVDRLKRDLESSLQKAFLENREIKGKELKSTIMSILPKLSERTLNQLKDILRVDESSLVQATFELGNEAKLNWSNFPDSISLNEEIVLVHPLQQKDSGPL